MVRRTLPHERGDEPASGGALDAFAIVQERHGKQIIRLGEDLSTETRTRKQELGEVRQNLASLAQLVTQGPTGAEEDEDGGELQPNWFTVDDGDQAEDLIVELGKWVQEVYLPAALPKLRPPRCWPWHPAVVADLDACRQAWEEAFMKKKAGPLARAEWFDRWHAGTQKRVEEHLKGCRGEGRNEAGEMVVLHYDWEAGGGVIYDWTQVPGMAHWWAETHGRDGSRAPGLLGEGPDGP